MCRRSGANVAVSYAQACCSNTCQLILTVDNCMSTQQNRTGSTTSVCNNTTSVQPLLCSVVLSPHPTSALLLLYFTTVGLFLLSLCPFLVSWWPAPSPSTSAAPDTPSNRHYCQSFVKHQVSPGHEHETNSTGNWTATVLKDFLSISDLSSCLCFGLLQSHKLRKCF